jgi:hypothetical protein
VVKFYDKIILLFSGSSWTPDPSIGHLLYSMRGVGPKMIVDEQGVGSNMDEAEEDYEFLVHLLRRCAN